MDLWTRLAVAAVLALLEDKHKLGPAKKALAKIYREIGKALGTDPEFRALVSPVKLPGEVIE